MRQEGSEVSGSRAVFCRGCCPTFNVINDGPTGFNAYSPQRFTVMAFLADSMFFLAVVQHLVVLKFFKFCCQWLFVDESIPSLLFFPRPSLTVDGRLETARLAQQAYHEYSSIYLCVSIQRNETVFSCTTHVSFPSRDELTPSSLVWPLPAAAADHLTPRLHSSSRWPPACNSSWNPVLLAAWRHESRRQASQSCRQ